VEGKVKHYGGFLSWAHEPQDGKPRSAQFPAGSLKWITAAWDLAQQAAYRDAAQHLAAIVDSLPYGREYDRAKAALERFEKLAGLKESNHGRR
jgi:hypothetical protein